MPIKFHIPIVLALPDSKENRIHEAHLQKIGFACHHLTQSDLLKDLLINLKSCALFVDADIFAYDLDEITKIANQQGNAFFTVLFGSAVNPSPKIGRLLTTHIVYLTKPITLKLLMKSLVLAYTKFGFKSNYIFNTLDIHHKESVSYINTDTVSAASKPEDAMEKENINKIDSMLISEIQQKMAENRQGGVPPIIQTIVEKLKSGDISFPILPSVAFKIQSQIEDENTNVEDIAKTLENEPVLSARIIAVANSPLYHGIEDIKDLGQAIARLGFNEVGGLVLSFLLSSAIEAKSKQFQKLTKKVWVHALTCAVASRNIAHRIGRTDLYSFFLYGLIHDLGKPFLLNIFADISLKDANRFKTEEEQFNEKEVIRWVNLLHTEFGEAVLKRWGLSKKYPTIARCHHMPKMALEMKDEAYIIECGNILAREMGNSISSDLNHDCSKTLVGEKYNIKDDVKTSMIQDVKIKVEAIKGYFGV